jgi:tRNA (guanine-N7-)-methyltransferase
MSAETGTGGMVWDRNYVSEHELKYMEMGVPIKAGIFRKVALAEGFDPTRYRLTPGVKKEVLARLGWEDA